MSNPALENAITTLNAKIGQPSEPTDWFEITQDRVNGFADATLDQQWIQHCARRIHARCISRRAGTNNQKFCVSCVSHFGESFVSFSNIYCGITLNRTTIIMI